MKTNVQITRINLVIHIDYVTVQHLSVHLVYEVIVIVILLLLS